MAGEALFATTGWTTRGSEDLDKEREHYRQQYLQQQRQAGDTRTDDEINFEFNDAYSQSRDTNNKYNLNGSSYEYGGRKGYAQQIADQNRAAGAASQQREGVNMYAGDAGKNLYESRESAQGAVGLLRGAASGQAPSQAAALMNAGTDQ